jgi:hypothetical protein
MQSLIYILKQTKEQTAVELGETQQENRPIKIAKRERV